ncbi:MAG: DUF3520 domain-containing protein, partial [Planctomycetaceae bacterium]|nr:DUF3520 domain-containing protein [Planctomycetaceae bacterium]
AKDVKIQLEFNPAAVSAYRLIGYENRQLAAEDFRNDRKDAGEIGAGHTVTALYELIPAGADYVSHAIPELKYQQASSLTPQAQSGELLTVRLRYKQPDDSGVDEFAVAVEDADHSFSRSSRDFQFAAAVASFGMLLRNSPHRGNATWDAVREWAQPAVGRDASGYREEFLELIVRAQQTAERHLSRVR